jgi:glycosyltransferase involved in cell wall biosynthesis
MPITKKWFKKSQAIPLAMSLFGKKKFEEAGFENVLYCPHAFSKDTFRVQDREECRKQLGVPQDAFVVGMVAANKGNPSRKNFQGAIQAFKILQEHAPEARLYLHTQLEDPDGEDLLAMCNLEKVRPLAVNQYAYALGMPEAVVAATHAAFDVLLCPSWGEGFGVPLIEAQASGTPCIVTNFSAMPEVAPGSVGNWNVNGAMKHTHWKSRQMDPSIEGLAEAMIDCYGDTNEQRLARRDMVAQWALAEYEVEHVVDTYMAPALEAAIEELDWRGLSMMAAEDDEDE